MSRQDNYNEAYDKGFENATARLRHGNGHCDFRCYRLLSRYLVLSFI